MFLIKGSPIASTEEGVGFFGLHHSYREGERYFRLVAELTQVPPDAHSAWAGPPGDFDGQVRGLGHRAPKVSEDCNCLHHFPTATTRTIARGLHGGGMHMVSVFFAGTV